MKACNRCSQPDRRRWVYHPGKCPKAPDIEIMPITPTPCTGDMLACFCYRCRQDFLSHMMRRMFSPR